jgi:4'-phosphopantetheinyl transferase
MIASEAVWKIAPERLLLKGDDVHVWRAQIDRPAADISIFRRILAPDELNRADKYHFRKDRDRFIVARAVLRFLLGHYLRREPEQLRFRFNAYGKPALAAEAESETLRFNLSHSGELALYAFTRNREVGLDVEYVRRDFDTKQLAGEFFSPHEVAALCALPASLQAEGFFRCWTRKEAYIKARGEGLSLPLHQFDVSLAPNHPAALLSVANDPAEISRWSLRELTPAKGYLAAIAVEGHNWQLNCFQWPDDSPAASSSSLLKIPAVEAGSI